LKNWKKLAIKEDKNIKNLFYRYREYCKINEFINKELTNLNMIKDKLQEMINRFNEE